MLRRHGALCYLCLVFVLLLPFPQGRAGDVSVEIRADVGLFYQQLAPYGFWAELKTGHLAWVPTETPTDWRPYTMGEWSYTLEQGWLWKSAWSWGWATFHYGRWLFDVDYGWAWVPGSQWAPSWVAWRVGGDVIGWAPLSPDIELSEGVQRLDDQTLNRHIDIYAWSFVPVADVFSKSLHAKSIIMSARNATMVKKTSPSTQYEIHRDKVVNYGVAPQRLTDKYHLDTRYMEMVDVTFPGGIAATHLAPHQVAVFRPVVELESNAHPPIGNVGIAKMSKDVLTKKHKSLSSSLDMYHMLEVKAMARIHNQQSDDAAGINPILNEQQQGELDSLKRLHVREQNVLKKRIKRDLEIVGGR
ncbi:DUF6600 domain-containing protein [Pseudomonadota bacterium]